MYSIALLGQNEVTFLSVDLCCTRARARIALCQRLLPAARLPGRFRYLTCICVRARLTQKRGKKKTCRLEIHIEE